MWRVDATELATSIRRQPVITCPTPHDTRARRALTNTDTRTRSTPHTPHPAPRIPAPRPHAGPGAPDPVHPRTPRALTAAP